MSINKLLCLYYFLDFQIVAVITIYEGYCIQFLSFLKIRKNVLLNSTKIETFEYF